MIPRIRAIPGIAFALLVLLFAFGHTWLGIYPYGDAVWMRLLVGLIGMLGAVFLLIGSGWWRIVLPVWCLAQTCVVATDVSGEWFFQGLFIGWKNSHSVRNNNVLTQFEETGINFAGLLLAGIVLVIMLLRLHPRIRWPISRRQVTVIAICAAIVLLPAIGIASWRKYQTASATFVLRLDLPAVPIYYQGQLLGRTPLAITPEKVKQWGLPLHDVDHLRLYSFGWADAEMLSDGQTQLPLYAGVPLGFAEYLDTFDSPWGQTRVRMHVGLDDGKDHQGHLYRKPELRDEPILTIQLLNPTPIQAGDMLHIRCTVRNPTPRTYVGRKTSIERYLFSFNQRKLNPAAPTTKPLREVEMPSDWNTLGPGATYTADVDFDGPSMPDAYEFFCTWDLFKSGDSGTLSGGCYSNMLYVNATTRPSNP